MKFSASLKRRLLKAVETARANRQLLRRIGTAKDDIATLNRIHPGRKVVVIPETIVFVKDIYDKPCARVIAERVRLAKPRFMLKETATAIATTQDVGLKGERSTSWPTWSMSSGTWHDDHLELYWKTKGVTRNTPHRKITGLVSPCDGWVLTKPTVGAVFSDGYERMFAIAKLGRTKTELLRLDGEVDCMYRAINLVKVKISKRTAIPRGALQFLGILGQERLAEIIPLADTGKTYGTGSYHAA